MNMNERERLISVLEGKVPDKTPWYGDLSYLYNSLQIKGTLDDKYKGEEGYLDFHRDLGVGICFYAPVPWNTYFRGGVTYKETINKFTKTSVYTTPEGDIRSTQIYLPESYTWAYKEHFIKDIKDLNTMLYIFENTVYSENFDNYNRIDRLWAGSGIAACIAPVPVAPLQKLLTRWAGVENTINIFMDNQDEFEEIIQRLQETENQVFKILCKLKSRYVEFAENLSSEITGKDFFEKYNMPYYKKRIRELKASGKFVGIHIDGTLKSCLPLLEKCGFDVAEAVTPSPTGDIPIEKLREIAGKKIVIWGGLPGAIFSPHFSENNFDYHVKKVLATFSVDSGFVLGVADQVPPDGLISRVRKIREMVETYG